jgi:hypothetical protein
VLEFDFRYILGWDENDVFSLPYLVHSQTIMRECSVASVEETGRIVAK